MIRLLLYIWIIVLIKLICLIKVVHYIFCFQTSLPQLNLTDKHGITQSIIYIYPSQCESWLPFAGEIGCRMASSSLLISSGISTLGSIWDEFVGILPYQSMSTLLLADLGWNALNILYSFRWVVFSSCISSNSGIHVSDIMYYILIQISNLHCTFLDGCSLASHCSQHVGRHPY